jgi:hypothetical protein
MMRAAEKMKYFARRAILFLESCRDMSYMPRGSINFFLQRSHDLHPWI